MEFKDGQNDDWYGCYVQSVQGFLRLSTQHYEKGISY